MRFVLFVGRRGAVAVLAAALLLVLLLVGEVEGAPAADDTIGTGGFGGAGVLATPSPGASAAP